jgi:hypothetical protein
MLAPAPLNSDLTPSTATIFWKASKEDLYLTAWSESALGSNLKNITYLARRHHHATTDSVERIRGDTSTSGDEPTKKERSQEVTLERSNKHNGLDGVVHTKVQTTVNNDTSNRGTETTVKTSDTIRGKGLAVDVDETVELTFTALLCGLGIVGKTGTSVVERVDEEQRCGTGHLSKLAYYV